MKFLEKIKNFFTKTNKNNNINQDIKKENIKVEVKTTPTKVTNQKTKKEKTEKLFGFDVETIEHGMTLRVKITKVYNDFYYAEALDSKFFQTITIFKKDCGDKKYQVADEIEVFIYRVTEEEILGKPIFIKNFKVGDIIHFRNAKKTEKGYIMYIYNKRFFLPFQEISKYKVNKNNSYKFIQENDELKIIDGEKDSFIVSKNALKLEEPIIEGKTYEGYIVNVYDYGYLISITTEGTGLLRFSHSSNTNVNRNLNINNKINVKVLKVDSDKILLVDANAKN